MNVYHYIRPTLLGASLLVLSACSQGSYTPPSTTAGTQQSQGGGQSELKRIADRLASNGDHSAAIPIYRQLGASGNVASLSALADSLIAQGAHDEARSILNMLVIRGQATGPVWYSLGKTQLAVGQFENALASFDRASAVIGQDSKILSGRAIALAALGRTGDAIAAFQAGTDRLTLSNKALIFAAMGNSTMAVHLLELMMQQGNGTSRDRQNLAMAYLLAGQETEARRIARIDLDTETIDETFTFYRSLTSLEPAHRMQALVTGTVSPEWTREETANLNLKENENRDQAAQRVVENNILARTTEKTQLAEAPKTQPVATPKEEPEAEPETRHVSRADYVLTEIPPLVEPEGWALQIGAYRTIKNLMRGWTILYRQSGDLLEDIPPRRSEVDFGDREGEPSGFYYRLNAGPLDSLKRAKELCRALIERGTQCWIRPPESAEGKLPKAQSANKKEAAVRLTAEIQQKN